MTGHRGTPASALPAVVIEAMRRRDLTPATRLVLWSLWTPPVRRPDSCPEVEVSMPVLAREAGVGLSQAKVAAKALHEAGLITTTHRRVRTGEAWQSLPSRHVLHGDGCPHRSGGRSNSDGPPSEFMLRTTSSEAARSAVVAAHPPREHPAASREGTRVRAWFHWPSVRAA